jgi:hypothetical protein
MFVISYQLVLSFPANFTQISKSWSSVVCVVSKLESIAQPGRLLPTPALLPCSVGIHLPGPDGVDKRFPVAIPGLPNSKCQGNSIAVAANPMLGCSELDTSEMSTFSPALELATTIPTSCPLIIPTGQKLST